MTPLLITVTLLLASAGVIYFASEFFVNGVEWLGRTLSVGRTATGTILAAFGTALPRASSPSSPSPSAKAIINASSASARLWAGRWSWPPSPTPRWEPP